MPGPWEKYGGQSPASDNGMLTPGTIKNLYDRPTLKNPDGSISTTLSKSFNFDGKEVLLPTVVNGKKLTDQEAVENYRRTGEHLGIFKDAASADAYATNLHNDQAQRMGLGEGPWSSYGGAPATATAAPVSEDPIGDQIRAHLRKNDAQPKSAGWFKETLSGIGRGLAPIAQLPQSVIESYNPQSPTEFILGPMGTLVKRSTIDPLVQIHEAAKASKAAGENWAGQTLAEAEAAPIIGPVVRKAEEAGPGRFKFEPSTLGAVAEGVTQMVAPEILGAGLSTVGRLRETARGVAQRTLGVSGKRVTEPLGEKFAADTTSHALSEKAAEEKLASRNQQIEAKNAAKTENFRNKASEAFAENIQNQKTEGRRAGLSRSLEEGSAELGNRVQSLDELLRTEGNEKYDAVRSATANDPGVPIDDLLVKLKAVEDTVPKGSEESIKQIRDLFKKYTDNPDRPNISFDDLQGYSSEIGAKLSTGNLPGDLYQALKGVKEQLDASKRLIAERNGAGATLTDADNFWRQYQSTFYDRPSAVAKTLGQIGEVDPKFYADSFIKGKGGDVAISNLKTLPTRHATEAGAVADLARNLRSAHTELKGMPRTAKAAEIPTAPTPVPLATRTPEAPPIPPTVDDITRARVNEIEKIANARHPYLLGGAIISLLLGRPGWALETLGGMTVANRILESEAVTNWFAKPSASDLKAIRALPEPARSTLRANLQDVLAQARNKGAIRIDPELSRALAVSVNVSKPVSNRQEALDRLKATAHDAGLGIQP